jgi:hypothetical protein
MVQNILMYLPLALSFQKLQSHHNNDITNHPLVKKELYQLQAPVRDIFPASPGLGTTDIQIRLE